MVVLVVAVFGFALVSAVLGLVGVRAATSRADRTAPPGEESGLVRLRARVGTGQEQVLIALVRELGLAREAADVRYGELYLHANPPAGFLVQTHSRLGRGLVAPLVTHLGRGLTEVTYSIVQLPQDEDLMPAVLDFEVQLIAALRRIDAGSTIRLSGTALRDLGRATWTGSAAEQRAPGRRA